MNKRPNALSAEAFLLEELLDVQEPNPVLEDFLQRLGAPLVRFVPYEERLDFLAQTRVHLEQSVRTYEEAGLAREAATRQALQRYGQAEEIAEEYLLTWYENESPTPLTKRVGRANLVAYGCFQTALVLYFVILQTRLFLPQATGYRIPWNLSPAEIRRLWPEPLPFPDLSLGFLVGVGYPLVAPWIAGWIAGRMIPARAARAVYHAMMPLLLLTFIVGALLLPNTEGLLFALFQVVYCLPVGMGIAHLSSLAARRKAPARVSGGTAGTHPPMRNL